MTDKRPAMDEWIIDLAREIFIRKLVNNGIIDPHKVAVKLAEDLTEELVKHGYYPYLLDVEPARKEAPAA